MAATQNSVQFPPKISCVIPTYNSAASVKEAVDSVLAQRTRVDEIVVVDDGSSDETKDLVTSFGNAVRYVYQENAGSSAARNSGIDIAQGDWIAFLDADDKWKPSKIAAQLQVLEQHQELAWIAGSYDNVSNGRFLFGCKNPSLQAMHDDVVKDAIELFAEGGSIWTGTVMVRRDVFDKIGNFDEKQRTSHDLDLWLRIAAKYPRLGWVTESVADYEINNPSGLTTTSVQAGDETLLNFYDRAYKLREALPASRQAHLQDYIQWHARALLRDFLRRGSPEQARWLLRHLNRIGVRMPFWLALATRLSPSIMRSVQSSVSYTRSMLNWR